MFYCTPCRMLVADMQYHRRMYHRDRRPLGESVIRDVRAEAFVSRMGVKHVRIIKTRLEDGEETWATMSPREARVLASELAGAADAAVFSQETKP